MAESCHLAVVRSARWSREDVSLSSIDKLFAVLSGNRECRDAVTRDSGKQVPRASLLRDAPASAGLTLGPRVQGTTVQEAGPGWRPLAPTRSRSTVLSLHPQPYPLSSPYIHSLLLKVLATSPKGPFPIAAVSSFSPFHPILPTRTWGSRRKGLVPRVPTTPARDGGGRARLWRARRESQ